MTVKPGLTSDPDYPSAEDQRTLETLALLTRIFAWLTLVLPAYVVFMLWLVAQAPKSSQRPGAMAVLFVLAVITFAFPWLYFKAASCIQYKEQRNLIYVAAALACTSGPLGLALGIYTFIVLERPSIRALFGR